MRGENGQAYANIVRPGEFVLGVLYFCSAAALEKMDGFEMGYHRERIEVDLDAGGSVAAVTYVADFIHELDGVAPSDEYVQRILRGGRQHGLPNAYLRWIEKLADTRPIAAPR